MNLETVTESQVKSIMTLLAKAEYPTTTMGPGHKALGASMLERHGPVVDWVRGLYEASAEKLMARLIDDVANLADERRPGKNRKGIA